MKVIRFIVLLLVVCGALNWGLWGFFQYDVIADIFQSNTSVSARIVYSIIGIAGLWALSFFFCPSFYGICTCKCHKEHGDHCEKPPHE